MDRTLIEDTARWTRAAAAGEVAAMRPHPGETSYDNALPWAEIKPASYAPADTVMTLLPTLQSRHDARVQSDPDFQCLLKDIADIKAQREKGLSSSMKPNVAEN
jgi:hypothetical protein